jgi:threonine dehydratase
VTRLLTLDEIERAHRAIAPHVARTPLRRSFALRPRSAYLKLECWQPTGSFKVRGAVNVLLSLGDHERARGLVAASAGNHALGVAFAAQAVGGGASVTVFVPESAPRSKVEKLRSFPIIVRETGRTYDDAFAAAMADAERSGAYYVHAFEDPATASGQGTVGLEILEDCPAVQAILVPVGGGGLIAGIATVVKARAPAVRIVAVQPEASPSYRESLRRGVALLEYDFSPTLADGIAGGIGEIAFAHRGLIDDVVTVSESEIEEAIVKLLAEDQVVAEGAGATPVAALLGGRLPLPDDAPVVAVVTGGNIDARVLARLLSSRA